MSQLLDRYLQLERQTGLFWPRRGVIEDNHATKVDSMTRSNKTRPKAVNHQVVDRDTVNSSFHVFKRRGTLQLWFSIYLYVVKPTESKKKKGFSRRKFLVRSSIGLGVIIGAGYLSRNLIRRYIAGIANTAEAPYMGSSVAPNLWEGLFQNKVTLLIAHFLQLPSLIP